MRSKAAAIRRISSSGRQPIKVPTLCFPADYSRNGELAIFSASHVGRLVVDDGGRDSGFGTQKGGSHLSAQFLFGVHGRTKRGCFENAVARKAFLMAGCVGLMPISA
jgi:hypothetical protein